MRKFATALTVVMFTSTCAFGGMISLTQTSPDPYFNAADGPTTATFDVSWDSMDSGNLPAGAASFDLYIGADNGLMFNMATGDLYVAFTSAFPVADLTDPDPFPHYLDSVYIAGSTFFNPAVTSDSLPMPVGQLTVDASALSAAGDYGIFIHADSELTDGVDLADPLTGGGAILTVVPEPTVLTLLGLGAIGLLRRRRAA